MKTAVSFPEKRNSLVKATLFCVLFTILFMGLSFFRQMVPARFEQQAHALLGIIDGLLLTVLFIRFDKRTFAGTGLVPGMFTPVKFFRGFIAGIILMGLLSTAVVYFTGFTLEINRNSNVASFLWITLPLLPLAFMEELAFRGYPFRILQETTGTRITILVTSLLFSLYHLANGWTLQNAFLGAGSWGIVFGAAAVFSKGIAMPTGLHYAVNLTTSAFGLSDNGANLWVLKLRSGAAAETYTGSMLAELIPQLCVLLAGLFLMERLARTRQILN